VFIYGGLVLLFQPFFKIALGRQIWNILDVVVGIGLIISNNYQTQKPAHRQQAHLQAHKS